MKFKPLIFIIAAIFAAQIVGVVLFLTANTLPDQDIVEINDILQDCTVNFDNLENVSAKYRYDFAVIDNDSKLLFSTKNGLSNSVDSAVKNRDTILDITIDGMVRGKLIINNNYAETISVKNNQLIVFLTVTLSLLLAVLIGYIAYINRRIIHPFNRLSEFASRISEGNLDTQLNMDRQNIFGAFTESFDIMRTELKNAKDAEQRATESKKLLIANLSHDIKTPLASIKAIAELSIIKADKKTKQSFVMIDKKVDQVSELVSNLFSATLEDMHQLSINESEYSSGILSGLIDSADYLKLAIIPEIPEMLLTFDKQRLQQVIDNVISNSYKYANTKIEIGFNYCDKFLQVSIKDFGGYNDNPKNLLTKFFRGQNADGKEGAGLGLYISRYLMTAMGGDLTIDSSADYFCVVLSLKVS